MNRWHEDVLGYLELRRGAGDRRAATLLARNDAPRTSPAKDSIASVAHHEKLRRQEEREESAAMAKARAAVWAWNIEHNRIPLVWGSRPVCDCGCGRQFWAADHGEFDHWIERSQGGPDTRENGWRLHHDCHEQKTANRPSRREWNRRRQRYCIAAGIPFVERRVR